MDAASWFVYVLQRLTLMLVILGVEAEEVRGCNEDLPALWNMVLKHEDRDKLLNDGKAAVAAQQRRRRLRRLRLVVGGATCGWLATTVMPFLSNSFNHSINLHNSHTA